MEMTTNRIIYVDVKTNNLLKSDLSQQLHEWWRQLNEQQLLPSQENYERMVQGIWLKENPILYRKEENKMIESMNLVDLYANKHKENIEKETKNKIEELKKHCEIINKYTELVKQFENDCDELYLSQFTNEEKNRIVSEQRIDDSAKELRRNYGGFDKYLVNKNFEPEGLKEVIDENDESILEVNDLAKMVKAHIGIAKTKEEVEEILKRYNIIDKKSGKLVLE